MAVINIVWTHESLCNTDDPFCSSGSKEGA